MKGYGRGSLLLKYNQLSNCLNKETTFLKLPCGKEQKICVLEVGGNLDVMRVDQGG